jgi:hypothetical protein
MNKRGGISYYACDTCSNVSNDDRDDGYRYITINGDTDFVCHDCAHEILDACEFEEWPRFWQIEVIIKHSDATKVFCTNIAFLEWVSRKDFSEKDVKCWRILKYMDDDRKSASNFLWTQFCKLMLVLPISLILEGDWAGGCFVFVRREEKESKSVHMPKLPTYH